jgi:hypothetical protein
MRYNTETCEMKNIRLFAAAAVVVPALTLAACDSAPENAVEDQAEAIDEAAEAQADSVRDAADGTAMEDSAEATADAIEAEGEATKDAMEDQADEMDGGSPQ